MVVSLTRKENIGRGTGVGGRENEFLVCWNTCVACCLVFNGCLVNILKLHWLPNALRMWNIYHKLCVCVCVFSITPKSLYICEHDLVPPLPHHPSGSFLMSSLSPILCLKCRSLYS